MATPADSLRSLLYQHMTGRPDDPSGMHEAGDKIGYLVELVEGMQMGDYDPEEVSAAFKSSGPDGFDFDAWYERQVDAGKYE